MDNRNFLLFCSIYLSTYCFCNCNSHSAFSTVCETSQRHKLHLHKLHKLHKPQHVNFIFESQQLRILWIMVIRILTSRLRRIGFPIPFSSKNFLINHKIIFFKYFLSTDYFFEIQFVKTQIKKRFSFLMFFIMMKNKSAYKT